MTRQTGNPPSIHHRRPAIASINPATGETIRVFEPLHGEDVEARIERAAQAYHPWRRTPLTERALLVKRVADILDEGREPGVHGLREFVNAKPVWIQTAAAPGKTTE